MREFSVRSPDGTRYEVALEDDVAGVVLVKRGPDGKHVAVGGVMAGHDLTPPVFAGLLHGLADNMPTDQELPAP